jgi:quercetin dioxygenase-like cupin family protein
MPEDIPLQRAVQTTQRFYSEQISPGVALEKFYPGGQDGPNKEVLVHFPGGKTWCDVAVLGEAGDPFQLGVPDVRMPANQFWPLHWHGCWVAIVVLEGDCLVGDWWMKPGDVLITEANVEYGPLLIGPAGCRMFEVFAQFHLQAGGLALEYREHPTLQYGTPPFRFYERSGVNKRNEGHSVLPVDGVAELTKGSLTPGSRWDLGKPDDPERGVMAVARLSPAERIKPHSYDDWHIIIVMDGTLNYAGRTMVKDDYLLVRPNSRVDEITGGPNGALLLELSRTACGMTRRPIGWSQTFF